MFSPTFNRRIVLTALVIATVAAGLAPRWLIEHELKHAEGFDHGGKR